MQPKSRSTQRSDGSPLPPSWRSLRRKLEALDYGTCSCLRLIIPSELDVDETEAESRANHTRFATVSYGIDLTNLEYSIMAEVMGHSFIAPEACNCSAP